MSIPVANRESNNEGYEPDKFAARFAQVTECGFCQDGYEDDGRVCNYCEGTGEA